MPQRPALEAVGGEVSAQRGRPTLDDLDISTSWANRIFRGRTPTFHSLAIADMALLFRNHGCAGYSNHQSIPLRVKPLAFVFFGPPVSRVSKVPLYEYVRYTGIHRRHLRGLFFRALQESGCRRRGWAIVALFAPLYSSANVPEPSQPGAFLVF
ncbi:hypothetical protein ABEF92_004487 [Exophiala dermatitidis]|uniref:Uncharacterized protein n=1 Tax=Exophiala dermatitidis (strain ATCC 34100 / CBS 525.76 / NIH/UT8656) TaxID=858893 RepID=H6BVU3_EXODN|nr:uncharacterized protein HMPREF1120_03251 [Exophiala dermatitidis NIH/UT8656]EHY55097.1 hypothetical protein HMPREF1120_03251 [Exophiala dermatitidis NIH/UT8656]